MRKVTAIILCLFFFKLTNAQFLSYPDANQGNINGGFGLTWIDGKPYNAFHFRPELAFSKIGVGLDLNLEFDANGKLNKENFNEFSDYLSVIRYVRYGYKNDPFYVRLGALDYASLGHGSIMYMYNKIPVQFKANFPYIIAWAIIVHIHNTAMSKRSIIKCAQPGIESFILIAIPYIADDAHII
jgi:hypothetical protein